MGENTAAIIIMTMVTTTTTTMMVTVKVKACECDVGLLYRFVGCSGGSTNVLYWWLSDGMCSFFCKDGVLGQYCLRDAAFALR